MQTVQRGINLLLFLFLINISTSSGQEKLCKEFKKLSCPEKKWVLLHPFVAKKTFRLTQDARNAAKEMAKDTSLDGDENGGQVDAFRHAYWMALLAQNICWRKARWLGKAHEKGDYINIKIGRLEDGALPDSVAGAMDLFNNKTGIETGKANKKIPQTVLKTMVRDSVLAGKMRVIKKNANGDYLSCDGNIFDMKQYLHQWNIPKCLVNSSYRSRNGK